MVKLAFARLPLTVFAAIVAGTPVHAQVRGYVLDTAGACPPALQALRAGAVHSQRNFTLRSCGAGAAGAVASAFRAASQNADTVVWSTLYALTGQVLDSRMIDSAEAVARDRTASMPARVVTMSALVTAYRTAAYISLPPWRALLDSSVTPGRRCTEVMTPGARVFGALPTDLAPRIANTFDVIAAEESAPSVVRAFATCARRMITEVSPTPRQLSTAYVCDNVFAVTTSAQWIDDVWGRIAGEPSLRRLAQLTAAPMEVRLSSVHDLQLFINDQLVASTRHGRVSCVANRYRQAGRAIPAGIDTLAGWAR